MTEAAVPAPKKGKPVLLIVAALVVAGGGAGAFFVLEGRGGGGGGEAAPAHGPAAGGEEGVKSGASLQGPITELPSLIVNLNEPEGTRYLKATVAVSLSDEKYAAEVERLKPVIRDQFIRELSELNFRQTMGAKNKLAVKRRLLKRFNDLLGADAGTEVFLTEFIVQ